MIRGLLCAMLLIAPASQAPPGVVGTWRGESICVQKGTSCNDEKVIYYISQVDRKSDLVSIRADKIVNGRVDTMGVCD